MFSTVLISGSRGIRTLPPPAIRSLGRILQLQWDVILGDAPGVDVLVQRYLKSQGYPSVTVYYALFDGQGQPRHTTDYPTIGVWGDYIQRNREMCQWADYGLAIWNGRSQGTLGNIQRLKKTKVIRV